VSLLWNDPALNIQWPLLDGKLPSLSAKDEVGLLFQDAPTFK
jgi:dTDP-4-dehydrorhamnose 3,5-epimerase